ncbi:unnamed protein product [Amoebophrya sp. A120]|nr:unnamed protein product [Amoebophrya sp. A120]|eukprot:GSA120T00003523001.1
MLLRSFSLAIVADNGVGTSSHVLRTERTGLAQPTTGLEDPHGLPPSEAFDHAENGDSSTGSGGVAVTIAPLFPLAEGEDGVDETVDAGKGSAAPVAVNVQQPQHTAQDDHTGPAAVSVELLSSGHADAAAGGANGELEQGEAVGKRSSRGLWLRREPRAEAVQALKAAIGESQKKRGNFWEHYLRHAQGFALLLSGILLGFLFARQGRSSGVHSVQQPTALAKSGGLTGERKSSSQSLPLLLPTTPVLFPTTPRSTKGDAFFLHPAAGNSEMLSEMLSPIAVERSPTLSDVMEEIEMETSTSSCSEQSSGSDYETDTSIATSSSEEESSLIGATEIRFNITPPASMGFFYKLFGIGGDANADGELREEILVTS